MAQTGNIKIKVFGQTAKDIDEGDQFVAVASSIEGRKVVTLEKSSHEWYESNQTLMQLAQFIQDRDGATALDTAEFLEKPWKWQDEYLEMLGVKQELITQ